MAFTVVDAAEQDSVARSPTTAASRRAREARSQPLVTVVIPTFNREKTIRRSLRSVMTQTYDAFEVIVVDDGSTDGTEAVVRSLEDARIRYCRQENKGVGAARNRGMREARGEFIAFLDSDDEWFRDKLELQVARFRELPDSVGLIYTGSHAIADGSPPETFIPTLRGDLYERLLERNVLHGTSSVMIRRSVVERVGYFDERYPAIEDYDLWLRVSACYKIDFVAAPLMRYHDARSAERLSSSIPNNLRARELFYAKHCEEMVRVGVAHLFLEESARRHLKRGFWAPRRARELIRTALAEQPRALRLYGLLAKSLIPTAVFRSLIGSDVVEVEFRP